MPMNRLRFPTRLAWFFSVVVAGACFVQAQRPTVASIAFSCEFPGSDPSHYGISLSSDGHASYISDGKLTKDSDSDADQPFRMDFTASASTVAHIFDLAKT